MRPDPFRHLVGSFALAALALACGGATTSAPAAGSNDAGGAGGAVDADCLEDVDCRSGLTCTHAVSYCGKCVDPSSLTVLAEGAACSGRTNPNGTHDTPCAAGLVCTARGQFDPGKCVRPVVVADGAACNDVELRCAQASWCPLSERTCRPRAAAGSVGIDGLCADASDCAPGTHCASGEQRCKLSGKSGDACALHTDCAQGLFCVRQQYCQGPCTPDTCAPRVPAGGACAKDALDSGQCADGTECDPVRGVCVPPHPMNIGDLCAKDRGFPCVDGAVCEAGDVSSICKRAVQPGGACGAADVACAGRNSCLQGVCVSSVKAACSH